jgi:DNA-binding transcriptional MerR regulator/methylmalonyl-CoA mutase cobalamin-binding subunit
MAPEEQTYSVGRVARLTGVSPDLLRAWERRYGAVHPVRTPGGTRRYRPEDIDRLRLLKAAVDAGHRISAVATLSSEELEQRSGRPAPADSAPLDAALESLARLDGAEAERLISGQLAGLGPIRFGKEFALPLLGRIGDEWAEERICVASEHLGSGLLRSLLGSALRPTAAHRDAPVVVFATLPGEHHDIGLLIAALVALGAGAQPVFLGSNLPVVELVNAAAATGAAAVALGSVAQDPKDLGQGLRELRDALPARVEVWLGGAAAAGASVPAGVSRMDSLTRLEQRVELLRL